MGTKDSEKEAILEEQKTITEAMGEAEESLKLFGELNYNTVVSELKPLDRARYDLAILYSINSMYWMYLRSMGVDTKNHPVMEEMNRLKKVTTRIKEMTEKAQKRTFSVDAQAAYRMVKHELWQPATKKAKVDTQKEEEDWDKGPEESSTDVQDSTEATEVST